MGLLKSSKEMYIKSIEEAIKSAETNLGIQVYIRNLDFKKDGFDATFVVSKDKGCIEEE